MDCKAMRYGRFGTRRAMMVTAAALAMACGGAALAQPMGPPGGAMGHGPGGHGFFGEHFGLMLDGVKARLGLDAAQQQLWDRAMAQAKTARETGRALHQKVRDAMRAELAKAEPDLVAMAAIADDAHAQGQALRRQVREQWLNLYTSLNAQQKAVVRELMQQKMDRGDRFRQRMRERFGGTS